MENTGNSEEQPNGLIVASHPRATGRHLVGSERGSTLILALCFILVVGAVVYSQVGLAFTGTRVQRTYQLNREVRYNANNALWAGVEWIKRNPSYGTEPTAGSKYPCPGYGMQFPLQEGDVNGNSPGLIVPGSYFTVYCKPTDPAMTGGVRSGAIDNANFEDQSVNPLNPPKDGQGPRDVVVTVRCEGTNPSAKNQKLSCGGNLGGIVAQARVRYEVSYDPALPPDARAVVPKVVWWHLTR